MAERDAGEKGGASRRMRVPQIPRGSPIASRYILPYIANNRAVTEEVHEQQHQILH